MILSNRDICIEYCYCNTLVKTHRKKKKLQIKYEKARV